MHYQNLITKPCLWKWAVGRRCSWSVSRPSCWHLKSILMWLAASWREIILFKLSVIFIKDIRIKMFCFFAEFYDMTSIHFYFLLSSRAKTIKERLDGGKKSASFEIAVLFTRRWGEKRDNFKTSRFSSGRFYWFLALKGVFQWNGGSK